MTPNGLLILSTRLCIHTRDEIQTKMFRYLFNNLTMNGSFTKAKLKTSLSIVDFDDFPQLITESWSKSD